MKGDRNLFGGRECTMLGQKMFLVRDARISTGTNKNSHSENYVIIMHSSLGCSLLSIRVHHLTTHTVHSIVITFSCCWETTRMIIRGPTEPFKPPNILNKQEWSLRRDQWPPRAWDWSEEWRTGKNNNCHIWHDETEPLARNGWAPGSPNHLHVQSYPVVL